MPRQKNIRAITETMMMQDLKRRLQTSPNHQNTMMIILIWKNQTKKI